MHTPRQKSLLRLACAIALVALVLVPAFALDPSATLKGLAGMSVLAGMAVTANQLTARADGLRTSGPVYEAVRLYGGTMAFYNATGYLVPTVNSGANRFGGIVVNEADNSSGASGDIDAELLADGCFLLAGTGFTQASVGLDAYASDNYTITTSSSSTSYVGLIVGYVSSTEVWVQIRRNTPTVPTAANASGTTAGTFQVDSDLGKPRSALASQTGGTGDYLGKWMPPSTLTSDRNYTAPADSDQTLVGATATQTLTNKTLSTGTKHLEPAQAITPDDAEGAGNMITAGTINVDVGAVTNDANDFFVLPPIADVPVGHTIHIAINAGTNCEMRTPASSNTKINDVDADGSQEYLCTDTHLIVVTKRTSTGWAAVSYTKLGAVVTAVVPD